MLATLEPAKPRSIPGRAMLTMKRSSEARKTPTARMAKISPGDPLPTTTDPWVGGLLTARALMRPPDGSLIRSENQVLAQDNQVTVGFVHALVQPVLRGRQEPRCRRRALDAADRPRAAV